MTRPRKLPTASPPRRIRFDLGKALPAQAVFWRALERGKRFGAYIGGIRGGKTHVGARRFLVEACRRGGISWLVGPTYNMAEVAKREFEDLLAQHPGIVAEHRDHPYAYWRLSTPKSPEIEVRSAEHPDRLRGPGLSAVWMDEAAIADFEAYRILRGRVMSERGVMFLTTTPKGKNWVHQEFVANPEAGSFVVSSRTGDNTFLDSKEVEHLYERWGRGTLWARQELDAEFVAFEGLVYPEFDPTIHVAPPPSASDFQEFMAGLDFGYNDPTALLVVGRLKQGQQWWVVDELYEPRLNVREMVERIAGLSRLYNVQVIWADGSRPELIAEVRVLGGAVLPSRHCKPKSQGFPRISALLRTGGLRVAPQCRHTITEFGLYSYKRKPGTDSVKPGDDPEDRFDHAMDALRYVFWSLDHTALGVWDWASAPAADPNPLVGDLDRKRDAGEPLDDRPDPSWSTLRRHHTGY